MADERLREELKRSSELGLAADFPTPSRDDWRALVAAVLAKSGASGDPEEALSHTTYDGIEVKPLYTAEDAPAVLAGLPGRPPFVRGATSLSGGARGAEPRAGWDVRTRHAGSDPEAVNRAALADLENGATSIWLVVGPGGLAVADLPRALDGVYLDLAPIALDAGARSRDAEQALLTYAQQRGVDHVELCGTLGADPIGTRARTAATVDVAGALTPGEQSEALPHMRLATVDATIYHDAGASDAQEIGIGTAVGVAYLRALVDGGLSVDEALARIDFRFAVTAEQFPSIAKLRAARRVWDRVAELSGASEGRRGQYQHAVTSQAMLTRRDPWVNLLRATIGCFAAAVGGADAITVTPFDTAIGVPDDFARRIARNTQSVLHDESSLARVLDAAGGSWYVESLTDQLAQRAWDVFTTVERAGGALRALDEGTITELIGTTYDKRAADIAHRRAPITGVSEYAFVDEARVERPPLPEQPQGLLPRIRYAQDFEALRDRTDAAAASGERPCVYLATLGPLAAHGARAAFAANLFRAAGLECVTGAVEDFDGSAVACLCSSDKVYADEASAAAKALHEAGARHVWLAGRGEYDGVDGSVHAGCDALAVLRRTLDLLEVPA